MKRFMSLFFAVCLIVAIVPVATLASDEIPELLDGVYEIGTVDQLYWFADQVNSGNTSINGKLIADIVVNENVLTSDGELNGDGSNFRTWVPIGSHENMFAGIFDGCGKTISGLYFKDEDMDYAGLFGFANSDSVIRNVGVVDSYFLGHNQVGSIAGQACGLMDNCYGDSRVEGQQAIGGIAGTFGEWARTGSIATNCYNSGTVYGKVHVGGVFGLCELDDTTLHCYNLGNVSGESDVGGVIGFASYHIINQCYNEGTVQGEYHVGGVVGINYTSDIQNCYNIGTVNGINNVGGIAGYGIYGTIANCYHAGKVQQSVTLYTGSKTIYISVDDSVYPVIRLWNGFTSVEYRPDNGIEREGDLWKILIPAGYYGLSISNGYQMIIASVDISDVRDCLITVSEDFSKVSVSYEGYEINDGIAAIDGCAILGCGDSMVRNCYYVQEGTPVCNEYGIAKSMMQFLTGEVCYLLQHQQGDQIWGQIIGLDRYPVFSQNKVYYITGSDSITGYSNNEDHLPSISSTLSGNVISYLNDEIVTLELKEGERIIHSSQISGNTASFTFENVPMGFYTLSISKNNHITREYKLVIMAEDQVLNGEICPKGDVTGEGIVNVKDYQQLLRHVNKSDPLSGYALACGDITGDGTTNLKDFQRLLRHVNKVDPLFD